MGNEICEWDAQKGEQVVRDATPEELVEIEERKLAPVPQPKPEKVDALIDLLSSLKTITAEQAEKLKKG